ncbi:MAG: hypothetical protein WCG23_00135 [bacterium]
MSDKLIIDKLSIFSPIERDCLPSLYRINEQLRHYGNNNFLNLNISVKHNKLWLTLCPYKFLYQSKENIKGITFSEFKDVIHNLNLILEDLVSIYNIKTEDNLLNFSISAIDLTTNIYADYFFKSYIPLFDSIKPKYNLRISKIRDIRATKEDSCIYFMSKGKRASKNDFTIRIYDKKEEMKQNKINPLPELEDKNIMRFELSFRSTKYIKKKLDISKLIDILSMQSFDNLEEKRKEILKDYLFHEVIEDDRHCLNSLNDVEIARLIKEKQKRNSLITIMLLLSADTINYKYLKDIFMTIGMCETHINNEMKKIKRYKSLYRQNKTNNLPTIASLYEEIYCKLFSDKQKQLAEVA